MHVLKSSLYVVSFENFNICLKSTYFDQRDLKLVLPCGDDEDAEFWFCFQYVDKFQDSAKANA